VTPTGVMLLSPQTERNFSFAATEAHFILESGDHSQSFVVSLTDPDLIAQARAQISSPGDFRARILIGQISGGSGGVNQNLRGSFNAPWSWHVAKVVKFAEMASQGCDGSPDFVEDFLQSWLDSKSNICFWSYRITRELQP